MSIIPSFSIHLFNYLGGHKCILKRWSWSASGKDCCTYLWNNNRNFDSIGNKMNSVLMWTVTLFPYHCHCRQEINSNFLWGLVVMRSSVLASIHDHLSFFVILLLLSLVRWINLYFAVSYHFKNSSGYFSLASPNQGNLHAFQNPQKKRKRKK